MEVVYKEKGGNDFSGEKVRLPSKHKSVDAYNRGLTLHSGLEKASKRLVNTGVLLDNTWIYQVV